MKRGISKNKTHLPTGDFIALGNKPTGVVTEIKTELFAAVSKGPINQIRPQSSHGDKLSKSIVPLNFARSLSSYESKAKEIHPSKLIQAILQAYEINDKELSSQLIFGLIKAIKRINPSSSSAVALGLNIKPEINSVLALGLIYVSKEIPEVLLYNNVPEALCSLLQKENYQTSSATQSKLKINHFANLAIIICNVLYVLFKEEEDWPEMFIKVYVEDAMGDRIWVDNLECKGFVENVASAFETKYPKATAMFPLVASNDEENSQQKSPFTSAGSDSGVKKVEPCPVFPRYLMLHDQIELYVVNSVTEYFSRRQPFENVCKNMLKFLTSTSGYSKIRLIASQRLEIWLHNPKLTVYAQDLLMTICANCNRSSSEDLEVISSIVKLRFKNKPNFLQHYVAALEELLSVHSENFGTVFKHIIYNELSSARNPNNMSLITFLIQFSLEASAKTLGEVYINLLCSKEDYTRALKALFKEIVRVNKHTFDFLTFCRTIQQGMHEYPLYIELDIGLKERFFASQIKLIAFSQYLTLSPKVKDCATLLWNCGKERDVGEVTNARDVIKSFKGQLSLLQLEAVNWLGSKTPFDYENSGCGVKDKSEFYENLTRLLLFSEAECHAAIKEIWASTTTLTENEKSLMFNLLTKETPVKLEIIKAIIELAGAGYLIKPDALNAIYVLVCRAAQNCIVNRIGLHANSDSSLYIGEDLFDFGDVPFAQIEDMLLRLTTLDVNPTLVAQFPPHFECCPIAHSDSYWKACMTLLIIVACRPSPYGEIPWNSNLTLRLLMEICLTGSFGQSLNIERQPASNKSLRKLTPAQALALETRALREIQAQILAAHGALSSQANSKNNGPNSSSNLTLTTNSDKDNVAELLKEFAYLDRAEARLLNGNHLILLPALQEETDAQGKSYLSESPYHFSHRSIPKTYLETLKVLNAQHKIGFRLCSCRDPDFLLSLIGRPPSSLSSDSVTDNAHAAATSYHHSDTRCWLSNMIENNEVDIINVIPVDCLCEYLYNEFVAFEENDIGPYEYMSGYDSHNSAFEPDASFDFLLLLCQDLLLKVTQPHSGTEASNRTRILQILEKLHSVMDGEIEGASKGEIDLKSAIAIVHYFGSKLCAEDCRIRNKAYKTLSLIMAYRDFKKLALDYGSSPQFLSDLYCNSQATTQIQIQQGTGPKSQQLLDRFKAAIHSTIFERAPSLWFSSSPNHDLTFDILRTYVFRAITVVEIDKDRILAYLQGLLDRCTTDLVLVTTNADEPDPRASDVLLKSIAYTAIIVSELVVSRYDVLKQFLKLKPKPLGSDPTPDPLAVVLVKIMVVFMQETLRCQSNREQINLMQSTICDILSQVVPASSLENQQILAYKTCYKIEQSHFLPAECCLIFPHKVISASLSLLIAIHDYRLGIDNFEELEHFTQFWFPPEDPGTSCHTLAVRACQGTTYSDALVDIMIFLPDPRKRDMLFCSQTSECVSTIVDIALKDMKESAMSQPLTYYKLLIECLQIFGLSSSVNRLLLASLDKATIEDYETLCLALKSEFFDNVALQHVKMKIRICHEEETDQIGLTFYVALSKIHDAIAGSPLLSQSSLLDLTSQNFEKMDISRAGSVIEHFPSANLPSHDSIMGVITDQANRANPFSLFQCVKAVCKREPQATHEWFSTLVPTLTSTLSQKDALNEIKEIAIIFIVDIVTTLTNCSNVAQLVSNDVDTMRNLSVLLNRLDSKRDDSEDLGMERLSLNDMAKRFSALKLASRYTSALNSTILPHVLKKEKLGGKFLNYDLSTRATNYFSSRNNQVDANAAILQTDDSTTTLDDYIKEVVVDPASLNENYSVEIGLRRAFLPCINPRADGIKVGILEKALYYNLRQHLRISSNAQSSLTKLLIDWCVRLNPRGVGLKDDACNPFLDIFFERCQTDSKDRSAAILPFQRYGLSLVAHEGTWHCLSNLITTLLSIEHKPEDIFRPDFRYHPTLVLDFLQTCLDLPRIWQGRDMRNKKKYEDELILDLTPAEFNTLLVYIMREKVIDLTLATNADRMRLVQHCLKNKICLQKSSISFLCDLIQYYSNSGSWRVDSSSTLFLTITYGLAYSIYLAFPRTKYLYASGKVFEDTLLEHVLKQPSIKKSQISNPISPADSLVYKVLIDGLQNNLMSDAATLTSGPSSEDTLESGNLANTLNLSKHESCAALVERAKEFLLGVARFHPHLLLRHLHVLAALLKGRTHLMYPAFVSKGHFAFFKVAILLVSLMQPHVFFYDNHNFEIILDCFFDFIKAYSVQTFKMGFHVKRIMNIFHNYARLKPDSATSYLKKQADVIRNLGQQYNDIIKSPFWISQLTACQAITTPPPQKTPISESAVSVDFMKKCIESYHVYRNTPTPAGELRRNILLGRLQNFVQTLSQNDDLISSNYDKDGLAFLSEFGSYSKSHPDVIEPFLTQTFNLMYSDVVLKVNPAYLESLLQIVVNSWRYIQESRAPLYDWYTSCITHPNLTTLQTAYKYFSQFCQMYPEHFMELVSLAFQTEIIKSLAITPHIIKAIKNQRG